MDFTVSLFTIIGVAFPIVMALWGILMRPQKLRLDSLEKQTDTISNDISKMKITQVEHSNQIDGLTSGIGALVDKLDKFIDKQNDMNEVLVKLNTLLSIRLKEEIK